MDMQKQEMREAVELPLTHHELYKQIGIDPPRGVLMYGPPGENDNFFRKATITFFLLESRKVVLFGVLFRRLRKNHVSESCSSSYNRYVLHLFHILHGIFVCNVGLLASACTCKCLQM